MAKKKSPKAELETTIRWDEEERVVHIWTNSPRSLKIIEKLKLTPRLDRTKIDKRGGKFFVVPLKDFRWKIKHTRKDKGKELAWNEEAPGVSGVPAV